MKRPYRIKIGPHRYKVIGDAKAERHLDHDRLAECDTARAEIRVRPGQAPTQERDSVLHEVLHACWDQTALRDHDIEEQVVSSLAPILLGVIRDNAEFMRWLADD